MAEAVPDKALAGVQGLLQDDVRLIGGWSSAVVAAAASRLLDRPLTAAQVEHKAIGFGLVRWGQASSLEGQAVSRLLVAGFGLPGQACEGTLADLVRYLHDDLRVLLEVSLAGFPQPLFEIAAVHSSPSDPTFQLLPASPGTAELTLTPADLEAGWSVTGCHLVVACRSWSCLPSEGSLFFGGYRDRYDSFHWNVAELDTNREGRILRY